MWDIKINVNLICFEIYEGKHDEDLLKILEETKGEGKYREMIHTSAWLRLEVLTNP